MTFKNFRPFIIACMSLTILSGCSSPLPRQYPFDGQQFYELWASFSWSKQKEYKRLVRNSLDQDPRSLKRLINFYCGGGSFCYWHGEVLAKIVARVGEDDFIKMTAGLKPRDILSLCHFISAGLEYGDFEGKPKGLLIKNEFPRLDQVCLANQSPDSK